MARKSTIGSNPLQPKTPIEMLIAEGEEKPAYVTHIKPKKSEEAVSRVGEGRARLAVVVDAELSERAKNAVYTVPGETLAGIVARALATELSKMEKANGGPFPQRPRGNLSPGRPVI